MTQKKLVVNINSLKVPTTKKVLLYEMKFLVPNYSCLQNGYATVYDNTMLTLKEAVFLSDNYGKNTDSR